MQYCSKPRGAREIEPEIFRRSFFEESLKGPAFILSSEHVVHVRRIDEPLHALPLTSSRQACMILGKCTSIYFTSHIRMCVCC